MARFFIDRPIFAWVGIGMLAAISWFWLGILDALEKFHLDDNDLKFLADRKVVSPETIKWLENFHFSGSIKGYREGEMFFPNSPMNMFCNRYLLRRMFISRLWHHVRKFKAAS